VEEILGSLTERAEWQIEIYIAEKFVPDSSTFEAEIASLNLKSYKSPRSEKTSDRTDSSSR
jgi:hypothetical protein